MRRCLVAALVLICTATLTACTASAADSAALKAGVFDPPRGAPDFSLAGSHGRDFRLSDFRGKIVLLGFGFTSCPDICPTTLAVLAQTRKRLAAAANNVQVIYVTVDPERDTAQQMRKYLSTFDPTFIGGTGSPGQLAAVRKDYGIQADKKVFGDNYAVAHSSFVYLIDRTGHIKALMPYGRTPDDYLHDVRLLLQQ